MTSGGVGRHVERNPAVSLAVGAGLVTVLCVVDGGRVVRARPQLGASGWTWAVVAGTVIALIVMAAVRLTPRSRRSPVISVVALVLCGVFVWTHPRSDAGDGLGSAPQVAAAVAVDLFILLAIVAGIWTLRQRAHQAARGRPAQAVDGPCAGPVDVWDVVDDGHRRPAFEPYHVARCECGWVGPAHEGPDAERDAFQDARDHAPDVRSDVLRPLG